MKKIVCPDCGCDYMELSGRTFVCSTCGFVKPGYVRTSAVKHVEVFLPLFLEKSQIMKTQLPEQIDRANILRIQGILFFKRISFIKMVIRTIQSFRKGAKDENQNGRQV